MKGLCAGVSVLVPIGLVLSCVMLVFMSSATSCRPEGVCCRLSVDRQACAAFMLGQRRGCPACVQAKA
eukprot:366331-Chlamydomonas_euryale.AAC.27